MKPTILFMAAAGCVATLMAQAPEPPAVIQILHETIKEGKAAPHTKSEQAEASVFRKNKFPFHYLGLNWMSGPNEVVFLSAYPSFAALEQSYAETDKQPLKGELDQAVARDGEYLVSSRGVTAVFRKDLSYLPENGTPIGKVRYMMLVSFRAKMGREEDAENGAKVFIQAYEKAKLDRSVICYQAVAGSQSGLYIFVVPMAALKSMDDEPARQKALVEAMGADTFHQLMRGAGDVFVSSESQLYAVSPEMSYVSKETEDQDPAFWRPKPAVSAEKPKEEKPKEKTTP